MTEQSLKDFTIGFRTVDAVDGLTAFSMTAEGAGAAVFIYASFLDSRSGALAGLSLICVGVIALFAHLGRPAQFWRVALKTTSAWISRGAVFSGILMGLIVLWLLTDGLVIPIINIILQALTTISALFVLLYTGFLYSTMASVPFWHNALLPMLFFFQSLTSGSVLLVLVSVLSKKQTWDFQNLASLVLALSIVSLILSIIYLNTDSHSPAVQESLKLTRTKPLRSLYRWGALTLGFFAPMMIIFVFVIHPVWQPRGAAMVILLILATIARFGGDFISRYCILKAGVYEPLI